MTSMPGGALRPLATAACCGRATAPTSSSSTSTSSTTSRRSRTRSLRRGRRARARQRRRRRRRRRAHRRAARAVTCSAAVIDLRSDVCAARRRRCGRRCARPARLGDDRRGSFRQRAAGARGRAARQGGGALGAHLRDGQPGRAADDRAAGATASSWKPRRTCSPRRRWGSRRSPARAEVGLRATDGRSRTRWSRRSSRPALRCSCSRTRTRGPAAPSSARADGRAGRGGAAPRRRRPPRRGAALQRRGRARRPGRGARCAGDTVACQLNKGLCAPIGAILAGRDDT